LTAVHWRTGGDVAAAREILLKRCGAIGGLDALKWGYRPYHTMAEFQHGFDDGMADRRHRELSGAAAQAYDRGYECARRWQRMQAK